MEAIDIYGVGGKIERISLGIGTHVFLHVIVIFTVCFTCATMQLEIWMLKILEIIVQLLYINYRDNETISVRA